MWGRNQRRANILRNFSFVEGIRSAFVTVEDKDPSVLWVCQDDSLVRHWFFQLILVPCRWEVLALDPAAVLSEYRGVLNLILPRSLLPCSKNFNPEHIPYAYCTVKKNLSSTCMSSLLRVSFVKGKGKAWPLVVSPPLMPTHARSLTILVSAALSLLRRSPVEKL